MHRGCRPWSLSEPFPACHSTPRGASSALRMLTGTCVCMLHCRPTCASQGLLDLSPGDSSGPKTSPEHWRVLRLIRALEHWALGLSCLSGPGGWRAGCYSLPGLACWPRFFSCLRAGGRQGLHCTRFSSYTALRLASSPGGASVLFLPSGAPDAAIAATRDKRYFRHPLSAFHGEQQASALTGSKFALAGLF